MTQEIYLDETHCVWACEAVLGEGPLWHAEENVLYFVDIKRNSLLRYDPTSGSRKQLEFSEPLGCIAPTAGAHLIAGFKDGVFVVDPESGERQSFVNPEPGKNNNRLNDGRCDELGNFWVGSMDDNELNNTGALWRISSDASCVLMDAPYCITNGPVFDPTNGIVYHTDTMNRVIYRFDYDAGDKLRNKRVFTTFSRDQGYPDGLSIDDDGGIWSGHWGGGCLTRFSNTGTPLLRVNLPVDNVTCCTFGGVNHDRLYITTARKGLTDAQLRNQPLAGGLFEVDAGFRGFPANRFSKRFSWRTK